MAVEEGYLATHETPNPHRSQGHSLQQQQQQELERFEQLQVHHELEEAEIESDLTPLLSVPPSDDDTIASASASSLVLVPDESLDREHQFRLLPYLYASHFLSRWGDRMWEFAVGLFMIEIWTDSLLLASLYGLVEAASVVAMGVVIGEWVDKNPRLKVVQVSLGVQNGSVVAATLLLLILLLYPGSTPGGYKAFVTLVVLVNILGGISALAGLATNISVVRDWVVVIAEGKPPGTLTRMNAVMKRIDLSCKLLAPILVGIIMSAVSVLASAILIAAWNVVSVGFEYCLLVSVYNETPELHERNTPCHYAVEMEMTPKGVEEDAMVIAQEDRGPSADITQMDNIHIMEGKMKKTKQWTRNLWQKVWHVSLVEGWKVYLRQEMVLAGMALSLLYLTVLSFGTLMTAVLKWRGVPAYVLGLGRGVSALVGIGATVAYPILHSHLQTVRTGLWAMSLQWVFLSLCVASVWVHSLRASTVLLMGGAAAARMGVWMFDLSVTQLMQESVPEVERGVVGGVQNSMQSLFKLLSFVAGMLIPHPKDFSKLVFISYGSVTMAVILYAIQVYRIRGHFLHIDRLFHSL